MIDRTAFLADAQKIVARLEKDLRARCDDMPDVGRAVADEYRKAKDAGRTGQTPEEWRADAVTQQAVAWVLSCVFVRFLEDNRLLDPPKISGPIGTGENRLARARDEHELFFTGDRRGSEFTDREYLLAVFDELATRPGTKDLYGEHNPIRAVPNWLSPDAAKDVLLPFFQKIDAGSGALVHDFTDPALDTRFLGDLYQDLSEAARKKYALLQTPVFVEEFILDRTLLPAVEAFGLAAVKMIDPACGSGHFLLGGFHKLLDLWVKKEPGTPRRVLVQRALDAVHGVDLNPYAVAIARFRLLLAAWQAAGVTSLRNAPDFQLNLACGDSLLHGGRAVQKTLDDEVFEHTYQPEDADALERLLRPGAYHAVIANPPYITPKDRQANENYRKLYPNVCHGKYSLSVPFLQRIFNLACDDGFTGQITANSFMKREFGKKLVEEFFPREDLTHVIDTSGAYIPGHGTPTVILLGRNRKPVASTIRTVMGIRGEPNTPPDPARGQVWTAVVQQVDQPASQSEFVSVADSPRGNFHQHPWSIGGGGAAELKEQLEGVCSKSVEEIADDFGVLGMTNADEVMIAPMLAFRRRQVEHKAVQGLTLGDEVRDWKIKPGGGVIFPYVHEQLLPILSLLHLHHWLWPTRSVLGSRATFAKKTYFQEGRPWWEWHQISLQRLRTPLSIIFSEVATHNHFVLDRGGKVFKQTAPVVKLPDKATEADHLDLLGLLNSSIAGFWLKQVCFPKGGDHVGTEGARVRRSLWDERYAFNASNVGEFPLPTTRQRTKPTGRLDAFARELGEQTAERILKDWARGHDLEQLLAEAENKSLRLRGTMIRLQEDLDWECYRLYGLTADDLADPQWESRELPVKLGERAFEIVLARKMRDEGLETTWFARHGSTPITELPTHWPDDYRKLVERRIAVIAANPQIALVEQPEYKRRWNDTPWADKLTAALHDWLLARLESYFDFDGRMREENLPQRRKDAEENPGSLGDFASLREVRLYPLTRIADAAARDAEFREVGRLYREGREDYDVTKLVAELVEAESVPLLPVLRYKPTGMDKRQAWERTWDLQRREDAVDARVAGKSVEVGAGGWTPRTDDGESPLNPAQAALLKQYLVDPTTPQSIPVPPKYKSADFQKADYWRLRGGLDVPKERWVSFPHCEGSDGLPLVAWAGYDHLQLAKAVATHYVHVQEQEGGRDDPRLVPLLAAIGQLLPWLRQWHNEMNDEFGSRMGDYYEGFVQEEARGMGKTVDEVCGWQPGKKKKISRGVAKPRRKPENEAGEEEDLPQSRKAAENDAD